MPIPNFGGDVDRGAVRRRHAIEDLLDEQIVAAVQQRAGPKVFDFIVRVLWTPIHTALGAIQAYAVLNSAASALASLYDVTTCSYTRREPIQSSTRAECVWLYTSSQQAVAVRQN
jgi:hypothetical protein